MTSECEATTPTAADGKNREHTPADRWVRERGVRETDRHVRETDVSERKMGERDIGVRATDRSERGTVMSERQTGQRERWVSVCSVAQ